MKKNFSNKMLVISIIAVMFIPFIYSAMFSLSVWDPYGRIDRLSVALVNEDKGTISNGKEINIGKSLENKLKSAKSFNWSFVSKDEAKEGIKKEKYYMALFLDENFSKDSVKLLDTNRKIKMNYITNQSRDYVADLITSNGVKSISEKLNDEITKKYLETIAEKIDGIKESIGKAKDGTKKLHNGSIKLGNGLVQLVEGLSKVADGHDTVIEKVKFAEEKYGQISSGLNLLNSKYQEFNNGQLKIKDGLYKAKEGTTKLVNNGLKISDGLNKIQSGLTNVDSKLKSSIQESGSSENIKKLAKLQEGSVKISKGISDLAEGSVKLNAAIKKINQGIPSAEILEKSKKDVKNKSIGLSNSEKFAIIRAVNNEVKKMSDNFYNELKYDKSFLSLKKDEQNNILEKVKKVENNNIQSILATAQKEIGKKIKEKSEEQKTKVMGLIDGLIKIRDGLDKGLVQGNEKLSNGLSELNTKYPEFDNGVSLLISKVNESKLSIGKLADGISQLKEGSTKINTGYNKYQSGIEALDKSMGEISNGGDKLVDGSSKIQDGIQKISDGSDRFGNEFFSKLQTGFSELSEGDKKIKDGTTKLTDGNTQISNGLNKLHNGLKDGKEKLDKSNFSSKSSNILTSPISLEKQTNKVANYGTSFLAYQLPLGLYLASIALVLVFPLINKNGTKGIIDKLKVLTIHAVVSAIIAGIGLQYFVKVQIANPLLFYLLIVIISLAYTYFIAFFTYTMGDVGKFVVLLFFILQLSTAGGTFPIELSNSIYVFLNKLIPLTYAMKGITYTLFTSTGFVHYINAVIYMGVMFIIFLVLMIIAYVKNIRKIED